MGGNTTGLIVSEVNSDPAIKKCLERGLINISALAKYIKDKTNLDVTTEAILSSLKRNIENGDNKKFNLDDVSVERVFKDTVISSKNKMVAIVIKSCDTTTSLLPELFSAINVQGGENIKLLKATESIEIIVDKKNLKDVTDIIAENKIRAVIKELAEITLYLDESTFQTVGVFNAILSELALHNINLVEAMSCRNEYIIIVYKKDHARASEILYNLCERAERRLAKSSA